MARTKEEWRDHDALHAKLRRICHGWHPERIVREYDLTYWQLLSALGYPIPSRIEERWPRDMNTGNPYKCGICEARKAYPELHRDRQF